MWSFLGGESPQESNGDAVVCELDCLASQVRLYGEVVTEEVLGDEVQVEVVGAALSAVLRALSAGAGVAGTRAVAPVAVVGVVTLAVANLVLVDPLSAVVARFVARVGGVAPEPPVDVARAAVAVTVAPPSAPLAGAPTVSRSA